MSRGVKRVRAGSLSFEAPAAAPRPLGDLEEAILIAMTGVTGMTAPDRPFQSPDGSDQIMGAPNLTMVGRSAGSPDNAQATHFFMINDTGTYYLRRLDDESEPIPYTPENLLRRADLAKQKVLEGRLDFKTRDFPVYLDSNRFLSNIPGTTILVPVVDLTRQYINALMYLLTQPDGHRPALIDDRNFYQSAGVRKWVKSGFLNKDIKVPLGILATMRTDYEALLLLQTLMLSAQAMGLGAWIHATISPPVMLGHPLFRDKYGPGLGFEYAKPALRLLDQFRWGTFLPKARIHPVGLPGSFTGLCPPMSPIWATPSTKSSATSSVPMAFTGRPRHSPRCSTLASPSATSKRFQPTRTRSSSAPRPCAGTSTPPTADSRPTATRSTSRVFGSRYTASTSTTTTTSSTIY